MKYFSESEMPASDRSVEVIPHTVWAGIVALTKSLISIGSFGGSFPELCPDGQGPIGTDEDSFGLMLQVEVPGISWPLKTTTKSDDYFAKEETFTPATLYILDLIQFSYMNISKPEQGGHHRFFDHYHLTFDVHAGQAEYREKINLIFRRNNLAFELRDDGSIVRLAPMVLRESLAEASFKTSDSLLNELLEDARRKFLNTDVNIRRESLEKLWDAWERLKSLDDPTNKRISVDKLIERSSAETNFRALLNDDARNLTTIGNTFQIRHSEVMQTPIRESRHVDYLFHRLFSLITLMLSA